MEALRLKISKILKLTVKGVEVKLKNLTEEDI